MAKFWRSGWVAKVITILVSVFAICCICSSILLALPTPKNTVAATATPVSVTRGVTETASVVPTASVVTATIIPARSPTFSPTAFLLPSETATVFPTATVVQVHVPITASQPFRVHFIDVGQGDSILIQATDGQNILIDGGDTDTWVVRYLQSVGVRQIDLMIATHPHADHIGGLVQVLRTIPVLKVVTNGQAHTTAVYEDFLDAIADSQAEYGEVKRGDMLQIGNLKLNVLSPMTLTDPDLNENSIVLRFNGGRTTYLMMGDAGANTEAALLASGMPLGANILKVGHHGSKSGSTVNGTIIVKATSKGYETETQKVEQGAMPTATFQPVPTAAPAAGFEIVSVTSPAARGEDATLSAQTTPNASCSITVYYKSGPSKAKGRAPGNADGSGLVSWTWAVGPNTTPGTWRIVVTCDKITKETVFTVQ
jgi:beta-lactamase superfamily II metal-dependent hydrolase